MDPKKSEQLPDARGLKKEVVMHRCDRFGEDASIRIPGAQVVEIGDREGAGEEELGSALSQHTAAVFTTPPRPGMVPIETVVRLAHEKQIPVILDVAWVVPPKENLWKFTKLHGVDAVIVSGGKGLRGPQGSGLILGRRELVAACQGMIAPHCRIGRPMKVGRETCAGIYAAVKHFLNGGSEATQDMASFIADALVGVPGIAVTLDRAASHVHVQFSPPQSAGFRDQIKRRLFEESPRILVRDSGSSGIRVNAGTLAEGQERVVAERLRSVLLEMMP
jgi:L-seryl-tRNA(Ser) seleniumtransferase